MIGLRTDKPVDVFIVGEGESGGRVEVRLPSAFLTLMGFEGGGVAYELYSISAPTITDPIHYSKFKHVKGVADDGWAY